jgi:chemotaxis protein MotB
MSQSPRVLTAIVGLGLVGLLSLGCVTKGKYKDLEAERDALAAEREAAVAEQDQLAAQLAATLAENEAMQATYGELVRELQSEVEAGEITIQELVDGIRLGVSDELLFSSGGVDVGEKGRAVLARVAGQIVDGDTLVFVEGHTDDVPVGPRLKERYPTNWELAGARAALVVRLLSENGVAPERMRAVSRGPFDPIAPNDSDENRAKNRRTDIILRVVPGT